MTESGSSETQKRRGWEQFDSLYLLKTILLKNISKTSKCEDLVVQPGRALHDITIGRAAGGGVGNGVRTGQMRRV